MVSIRVYDRFQLIRSQRIGTTEKSDKHNLQGFKFPTNPIAKDRYNTQAHRLSLLQESQFPTNPIAKDRYNLTTQKERSTALTPFPTNPIAKDRYNNTTSAYAITTTRFPTNPIAKDRYNAAEIDRTGEVSGFQLIRSQRIGTTADFQKSICVSILAPIFADRFL